MSEYTSQGQGTLNTVLGAVGAANAFMPGFFGGGLFGNYGRNYGGYGYDGYGCHDRGVSREAFDLSLSLANVQKDNAILAAELADEKKIVEAYTTLDRKINGVDKHLDETIGAQAVVNCNLSNRIGILETKVGQLMSMTKLGITQESLWPEET